MTDTKKSKKQKETKQSDEQIENDAVEYSIKPEKGIPSIDTSTWPLLLKVITPKKIFLILKERVCHST